MGQQHNATRYRVVIIENGTRATSSHHSRISAAEEAAAIIPPELHPTIEKGTEPFRLATVCTTTLWTPIEPRPR